jgi:hypothetical protein
VNAPRGGRDRRFAFVALILASCGSPPTPAVPVERPVLVVAAPSEPPEARSAPPGSRAAAGPTETWEGEYTCTQGVTALTLHVTRRGETALEATFMFRASDKNPGVPTGAYTLVGQMRPDRSFELTPSQWIDRPGNYIMVGMAGDVDGTGTIMRGRITEDACGGFELRRVPAR